MSECVIVDCQTSPVRAGYCMACYRQYVCGDDGGGA